MYRTKVLLVTAAAVVLAACGTATTMSADHGVSNKRNIAMQVIDAKASERDLVPQTLDGMKAEKAVERYRKDRPDESRAKLVDNL